MSDNDLILRGDVLAWLSEEADRCDDSARWGGHPRYVSDCKAAAYALRSARRHIEAKIPAQIKVQP